MNREFTVIRNALFLLCIFEQRNLLRLSMQAQAIAESTRGLRFEMQQGRMIRPIGRSEV